MSSSSDVFLKSRTPKDIANSLGISLQKLNYYLYKAPLEKRYKSFHIKKKSGGLREIRAPSPTLKFVQQNLLEILCELYSPKPSVHGGVRDRSIITNASPHRKAKLVINFDLNNFFNEIHFGRVRGMFCSRPFEFPTAIATIIANLCCSEGRLPQGAPTSPIIANIICRGLDRDFQNIAKLHGFYYTRYADDITFSTKRSVIPPNIAHTYDGTDGPYTLGDDIITIVKKHGFSINENKTRIQRSSESQVVTGLKVNRFVNVDRKHVRKVRAMLHAWETFGHEASQTVFFEKYDHSNRHADRKPEFRRVVKGHIDYLKMVRGTENEIYKKLVKKYRILEARDFKGDALHKKAMFTDDHLKYSIFIIEYEWEDKDGNFDCSQGTAFALDGFGFVTCAHVLPPDGATVTRSEAWRCTDVIDIFNVEVLKKNTDLDLAIISINTPVEQPLVGAKHITFLGHASKIVVAGFPNYKPGDDVYISSGHVTQRTKVSGIDRFVVSAAIVAGNSGGPVLNEQTRVVGVAATGIGGGVKPGATHYHTFIPISALKYLV